MHFTHEKSTSLDVLDQANDYMKKFSVIFNGETYTHYNDSVHEVIKN